MDRAGVDDELTVLSHQIGFTITFDWVNEELCIHFCCGEKLDKNCTNTAYGYHYSKVERLS